VNTPITYRDFTIDPVALELRRGGARIPLTPQAVRLLLILVQRRGELVSRQELYGLLWGTDHSVDVDRALNTLIRHVRRALGDRAEDPVHIFTYPGRGYRLQAEIPVPRATNPRAGSLFGRWLSWASLSATAVAAAMVLATTGRSVSDRSIPESIREEYLLARHLLEQPDIDQRARAATLLTDAVRRAPDFAPLHADLAFSLAWGGRWAEADSALATALSLDSTVARAWLAGSFIALVRDWDWAAAEARLHRAIARQPDDAELLASLGFVLATAGRRDSAAAVLGRARALDPVSAIVVADIGQVYRYIGRDADAADACERANAMSDVPSFALRCVLDASRALGDLSGAREAAGRIVAAASGDSVAVLGGASVPDETALRRFDRWAAGEAGSQIAAGRYTPFAAALALTRAGRAGDAVDALRRVASARGLGFVTATVDPTFATLRRDPAYLRLVEPLVRGGAAVPGHGG
jgi:DNA-binding winged helix-turn-helix (wHTH) protein/Flp pilus assembly protein TadD